MRKAISILSLLVSYSLFGQSASSELAPQKQNRYSAKMAMDGDLKTAWIEGTKGFGVGERWSHSFGKTKSISAFSFIPGYSKSQRHYQKNAVPILQFQINNKTYLPLESVFEYKISWMKYKGMKEPYTGPTQNPVNLFHRLALFNGEVTTKGISAKIHDVFSRYGVDKDAGISEIQIFNNEIFIENLKNLSLSHSFKERNLSNISCPKALDKTGRKLDKLKGQDWLELARERIKKVSLSEKSQSFEVIYFQMHSKVWNIVFPSPVSNTCYSDGEGGDQLMLSAVLSKNGIESFELVSRQWPVP